MGQHPQMEWQTQMESELVDDFLLDGEEPDIVWFDITIDGRFDCKPLEFLAIDCSIEHIGMEIIMTVDRICISCNGISH